MKILHKTDYRERRRKDYPHLGDFADAMYWAERGDRSKLDAYFARIDEIKARYPKPAPNDPLQSS